MKNISKIVLASLAAILCLVSYATSRDHSAKRSDDPGKTVHRGEDWPEQERIDRFYQLSPGARVEVSTIFGPVDIDTTAGQMAEVQVTRFARAREDLTSRRISIEHTPMSLVIRGERDHSAAPARVRHRVVLRVPRQVMLLAQDVNARVNVGEIDGTVRLASINGAVTIGLAAGHANISRINGSLSMNLTRLSAQGIQIERVNGGVDLRFTEALNADMSVTDFNGSVGAHMPAVVIEKTERAIFRARLGAGGTPITISEINGSVRLALLD